MPSAERDHALRDDGIVVCATVGARENATRPHNTMELRVVLQVVVIKVRSQCQPHLTVRRYLGDHALTVHGTFA